MTSSMTYVLLLQIYVHHVYSIVPQILIRTQLSSALSWPIVSDLILKNMQGGKTAAVIRTVVFAGEFSAQYISNGII